jgi:hypothetical protein
MNSSLSSASRVAWIVAGKVRCLEARALSLRGALDWEGLPVRRRKSPPSSPASRVLLPASAETGRGGCRRRRLALGSVSDICYSRAPDGTNKLAGLAQARYVMARLVATKLSPSADSLLTLGRSRCLGCSSSRPQGRSRGPSHNYRLEYSLVALEVVWVGRTRDQIVLGYPY